MTYQEGLKPLSDDGTPTWVFYRPMNIYMWDTSVTLCESTVGIVSCLFCVSLTTLLPRDTVENSCKEPGYRKRPKRCFVSTNPVCMPLFMTLRCQLLLHFCCCCCFFWQISIGARKRTFSVPYFSLFTCVAIPFWKPLEFNSLYTVNDLNPNKDQTFFEALICFNFPT